MEIGKKLTLLRKHRSMISFSVVALMITVISNACGAFQSSNTDNSVNGTLNICKVEDPLPPTPGAQTLGIVYGANVLENMVSCTGLGFENVSTTTQAEFDDRSGSFSQYGEVSDVTSAMMMGVAAVAIEVCNDLIDKELPLDPSNPTDLATADLHRRIFNAIDFNSTSISNSAIAETAARVSRSCLSRDLTVEENQILVDGINALGTVSNRERGISICSSILSSLSAVTR